MGNNECPQPASKSSWDSQDIGDINMVLKMARFPKSTGPRWVSNHVAIGLRAQDFVGDDVITSLASDSEITLSCSRDDPWNMGAVEGNWSVDVLKILHDRCESVQFYFEVINGSISQRM